jgi:hypothetical protein
MLLFFCKLSIKVIYVHVRIPVRVNLCPFPCPFVSLPLSVCVSVRLCPCACPSVSLCLSVCVPIPVPVCLCPCLSVSLSFLQLLQTSNRLIFCHLGTIFEALHDPGRHGVGQLQQQGLQQGDPQLLDCPDQHGK